MDSFENNNCSYGGVIFTNTTLKKLASELYSYRDNKIDVDNLVNEFLNNPNQIKNIEKSEPDEVKQICNLALDILKDKKVISENEQKSLKTQVAEATDVSVLGTVWQFIVDVFAALYDATVGADVADNNDIGKLKLSNRNLLKTGRHYYIESANENSDIIWRKEVFDIDNSDQNQDSIHNNKQDKPNAKESINFENLFENAKKHRAIDNLKKPLSKIINKFQEKSNSDKSKNKHYQP